MTPSCFLWFWCVLETLSYGLLLLLLAVFLSRRRGGHREISKNQHGAEAPRHERAPAVIPGIRWRNMPANSHKPSAGEFVCSAEGMLLAALTDEPESRIADRRDVLADRPVADRGDHRRGVQVSYYSPIGE